MKNKPLRQRPRHGCLKMWAEMGRLFSLPVAPDLPQPGVVGLSARSADVPAPQCVQSLAQKGSIPPFLNAGAASAALMNMIHALAAAASFAPDWMPIEKVVYC